MAAQVKNFKDLTLTDRLSRLSFKQACDLLGGLVEGRKLLYAGGKISVGNLAEQARLTGDLFRLSLPTEDVMVTITMRSGVAKQLHLNCDRCDTPCSHLGAALSVILDSKTALGLAQAPQERPPLEPLSDKALVERALGERQQRAKDEKMLVDAIGKASTTPWIDYVVTSKLSGKSYRVALRGAEPGDSFCTCPDFRTNTLGTCKHILHTLQKIRRRFGPVAFRKKPKQKETSVYLKYGVQLALRLGAPDRPSESVAENIAPLRGEVGSDHFGRRPAHQELGSSDHAGRQKPEVPVCPGAVRNAARESAG